MEETISQAALRWFKDRGITEKTLKAIGVYTGRRLPNGDSFKIDPDVQGNVIVFPYIKQNQEVNAKYREHPKNFYQKPNGVKTFFNSDILADSALKDGSVSLVITEGEMDALAVMEAGYLHVVSVPDGAPPDVVGQTYDVDIDIEHDTKYRYIFNHWDVLKSIKQIIIATDNDGPGKRLAEELVRRLGRVRCRFVEYPEKCKDFNDVLVQHGQAEVIRILSHAKPYPVSGVYSFSELPTEPDLNPLSTGWGRLDEYIRPFYPAFMVVTGTAGSGKSTWVNQLVAQMSIIHGISVAIASFEMRINPFVSEVLVNTYAQLGTKGNVTDWLEHNFVFICPEPGGEPTDNKLGGYGSNEDGNYNIDWLIERAEAAVIRYGIRILVIDPWNEIEHAARMRESHTDYIGRAIRALKRFGREFDVLVIVVAHPAKYGAQKPPQEITLYDISDSAHFANKADFGVVIAPIEFESSIMVKKVRYQTLTGKPGTVVLTYDPNTRTFGQ